MPSSSEKLPVPKPFTRAPIPSPKVQTDRKKKHSRQDKHKRSPVLDE